ncbi:MAG: alkaline phosphatase family protein [Anaerolineae bacterium]
MSQNSRRDSYNAAKSNPKVLLIGIDSATWRVMMPLIEEGKLPNFASLMENGAYGSLKNFLPTLSPLIWGTISTGKTPEKHGMKTFTVLKLPGLKRGIYDYRWEQLTPFTKLLYRLGRVHLWKRLLLRARVLKSVPLTSNFRKCKAIWNIVSDCGRTVGFVSWWNSWPAEEVNGFWVSQYVEHLLSTPPESSERMTYPTWLFSEAVKFLRTDQLITQNEVRRFFNVNGDEMEELMRSRHHPEDPDPLNYHPTRFLKLDYLRHEFRSRVGLHFYQKYRPELFGVMFSADGAQHFFWHCMEPQYFDNVSQEEIDKYGKTIENFYIYLDEIVGRFLKVVDEESTIIVISDHGHGPSGKLPWSGQHEDAPDGIIILSGKAIKSGLVIDEATVYDVAPTILTLMGLPVASDLDGRVVSEVISPQFLNQHPIKTIETYETEGIGEQIAIESDFDEEVIDRLRDLGYIE